MKLIIGIGAAAAALAAGIIVFVKRRKNASESSDL
ncbi:MAG: LPXTG cell wall anchor domain-containing protein [Oscillospiraceae bacterium]